jgi:signal recognition particle receptor subunit beta
MVLFNYSTRELTAKIVYYGPGICGKTTNLQFIHENLPGEVRGKMLSLATKTDRTLFFDFLPIDLGEIRGMKTRVQLYTVPGQVFYNETRKLVLKGVDGIVFVADSQETMLGANVESFKNLEENLKAHGMKLAEIPHVIQFNKRDLPRLSGIEDLNASLNKFNAPFYESVATTGIGVQDTLKAIVKLVLLNLTRKYEPKSVSESPIAAPPAAAVAAMASMASAPAPARRAASPVAESSAAAHAAPETTRTHIPLSPMETPAVPRRGIPVARPEPRKSTPAPVEAITSFGEDEIDGLVGEVEEIETPIAPSPMPVEEGAWLGTPETEDEPTFADPSSAYGSNVPIDDLLEAHTPPPAADPAPQPTWQPAPPNSSDFEVDRGFDPEWSDFEAPVSTPPVVEKAVHAAPRADDLVPIAPFPLPELEDAAANSETDLTLTEVASNDDLFSDPSLEIAQLADGQAREIIVPVMLGEGVSVRRFKLAIRLRLDAVD